MVLNMEPIRDALRYSEASVSSDVEAPRDVEAQAALPHPKAQNEAEPNDDDDYEPRKTFSIGSILTIAGIVIISLVIGYYLGKHMNAQPVQGATKLTYVAKQKINGSEVEVTGQIMTNKEHKVEIKYHDKSFKRIVLGLMHETSYKNKDRYMSAVEKIVAKTDVEAAFMRRVLITAVELKRLNPDSSEFRQLGNCVYHIMQWTHKLLFEYTETSEDFKIAIIEELARGLSPTMCGNMRPRNIEDKILKKHAKIRLQFRVWSKDPVKLGMDFSGNTVMAVHKDSQAMKLGVKVGWRIASLLTLNDSVVIHFSDGMENAETAITELIQAAQIAKHTWLLYNITFHTAAESAAADTDDDKLIESVIAILNESFD